MIPVPAMVEILFWGGLRDWWDRFERDPRLGHPNLNWERRFVRDAEKI